MNDLADLIQKLEQAQHGSRWLDADIAVAIHHDLPGPQGEARAWLKPLSRHDIDCAEGTYWLVQRSGMALRTAPTFTKSIDHARLTVPEGMLWHVGSHGAGVGFAGIKGKWWDVEHDNQALALCTASLKAREPDQ